MQSIYFGPDPRGHQRFLDIFHVVAGGIGILLAILSVLNTGAPMRFFPLIFLDAAALKLVSAYSCFHSSDGRTRRVGAGLSMTVVGVLLLLLTYISGTCIWG